MNNLLIPLMMKNLLQFSKKCKRKVRLLLVHFKNKFKIINLKKDLVTLEQKQLHLEKHWQNKNGHNTERRKKIIFLKVK